MDTKKKFTSPLQGLFGKKKSPSPPPAQKTAARSSLDSEVTLLERKKESSPKSEVRTRRESRRSGSSASGFDAQELLAIKGRGLEAGWALLARGAAEDPNTLNYTSVYAQTSVLGRLAKGLTTPHSPYDYALPPSPSRSPSLPPTPLSGPQQDKKDVKAPRPPLTFH